MTEECEATTSTTELTYSTISIFARRSLSGQDTMKFTSRTTPDEGTIIQYVYGSLSGNMSQYHKIAHLMEDGLIGTVNVKSMVEL